MPTMMPSSDADSGARLVVLKGGVSLELALVCWMLDVEDRGVQFSLDPDGCVRMRPGSRVPPPDLVFARAIRTSSAGRSGLSSGFCWMRLSSANTPIQLGARTLYLSKDRQVFDLQHDYATFAAVGKLVRDRTDPNAVIVTAQHSGSIRVLRRPRDVAMDPLLSRMARSRGGVAERARRSSVFAARDLGSVRVPRAVRREKHCRPAGDGADARVPQTASCFSLAPTGPAAQTEVIAHLPMVARPLPAPPPTVTFE